MFDKKLIREAPRGWLSLFEEVKPDITVFAVPTDSDLESALSYSPPKVARRYRGIDSTTPRRAGSVFSVGLIRTRRLSSRNIFSRKPCLYSRHQLSCASETLSARQYLKHCSLDNAPSSLYLKRKVFRKKTE